ncbi:MAG: hypothetical protein ABI576_05920 [Flavobacterium sp.]
MKKSIKFIGLMVMIGAFTLSCKKTAENTPDTSTYDMDTTSTTTDSINPNIDTTNVNKDTTATKR